MALTPCTISIHPPMALTPDTCTHARMHDKGVHVSGASAAACCALNASPCAPSQAHARLRASHYVELLDAVASVVIIESSSTCLGIVDPDNAIFSDFHPEVCVPSPISTPRYVCVFSDSPPEVFIVSQNFSPNFYVFAHLNA